MLSLLYLYLFSHGTTLKLSYVLPVYRQFPNQFEIILKITSSHVVIISFWSQGNWGLGIKPGRSTGTVGPMAQTNVSIYEVLLCPARWECEPINDDMMVMMMMMWVYIPKLAGQRSPSDLATMDCAM